MKLRNRFYRLIRRRSRGGQNALVLSVAFVAGVLGGCTLSDGIGTFMVDPGHYSAYHCKDFAPRLAQLAARQQQLRELMDKASEGSGGAVIGNLSYRTEYEDLLGEEKVLRRSAAEKNCELPAAATASPAAPAVQPASTTPTSYQSDQTIR